MLAVSFVQIIATIGATRIGAQTSASLGREVRSSVFHRVGQFSAQELSRFGAPTLISRSTNDVTQVQTVTYMFLAIMVSAPIMMVGGIFMALREDLGLAWLVAVAVPALGVAIGLIISRMVPHFRSMQTAVDSVNRILREQITGLRVVRAFVREDVERERFAVANRTYTGTALAVGKLMALAFPVVMIIFNASTVAVLWFGAHRIDSGQMEIGALTAFMSYLIQILMSVMMATFMAMMIPRATVSAGRIQEVLDTESSVHPPADPAVIPPGPVDRRAARRHVRLPGRRVAGAARGVAARRARHDDRHRRLAPAPARPPWSASSRGCTTSPTGQVLVGGVDVRDAELEDLWSHIGLVPQRPYLFTGTVASQPALRRPRRHRRRALGGPAASPRPTTSCGPCPTAWSRRSPRAAPTSAAGSASGWPSRGPW